MHFITLNKDGAEGSCRAHIFTSTATDAFGVVDGGHHGRFVVIGIIGDHHDGL